MVSSVPLPWMTARRFDHSAELAAIVRSDILMPSKPKFSQYSAAAWKKTKAF